MRFFNHKFFHNRQRNKRIMSAFLVAGLLLAVPAVGYDLPGEPSEVFASSAQQKKDEAESGLKDANDAIDNIKDKQENVEGDIASAEAQLEELLSAQAELEGQIEETEAAIEQANLDLEAAKQKEEEEYESMKLRIQFMYENDTGDSLWKAIVESNGIVDMLNRVEYVSQVHESDRELMAEYEQAVQEVETLTEELALEMDELLTLQEGYLVQQEEVETLLASLESQAEQYATELAEAEALAESFRTTIEEQNQILAQQSQNSQKPDHLPSNPGTSASGTEIVNYALQFVGNPYVWGGNSLTEGCDCSGFVNLVYRHFGYKGVPRYSLSFATYGRAVSYDEMQPGDIVVYDPIGGVGHVGIYIGNGNIVEAQSSKAGITSNRKVNCRPIRAIRRVVD